MPLLHCKECHHEWEGMPDEKCDWCGAESFTLEEQTPLDKLLADKENLARLVNKLIKEWGEEDNLKFFSKQMEQPSE